MADKKISALTSATLPLAGTEVVPLVQSSTTKKVAVSYLTAGRDVQANNLFVNLSSSPGAFNNTVAISSGASSLAGLQLVNNAVGSSYNTGLQVFLNGTDGYVSSFNGPLYVQTGGYTIRAEYDLSGNYKVNNGNVIVGTAGKGIDFSANANAPGMTSELLNWYEEGVFTPVFNNLTVGNGSVDGRYTRIGRMVTATIRLNFGSTSAWTGTCANVAGLPYVSVYAANGCMTMFQTNVGWFGGQVMIYANNSQLSYPTTASGTAFSATTPWTWGAGDFAIITISYEA